MDSPSIMDKAERPYICTGHLPDSDTVQRLEASAYLLFKSNSDSQNSQVYPALAMVPSNLLGICVVGTNGHVYAAGDVDYDFSIMSVSKPFVFALVRRIGPEEAREKLGASAIGQAFNCRAAIEHGAPSSSATLPPNPVLPKELQSQVNLDSITTMRGCGALWRAPPRRLHRSRSRAREH